MLVKEKYESNLQLWNSSQDWGCDEELPGLGFGLFFLSDIS